MHPVPLAPRITDGVVTLRPHRLEDAARVLEQSVDPVSRRWTTIPLDYTASMAVGFVTQVMPRGWLEGTEWGFALEVGGQYAGTLSLRPEVPGRAEVAYGAHPDVRGTGAVARGLRLLIGWGFEQQGLESIVWRAFTGNWASRRTAWRLGFRVEGTLRSHLPQRGGLHDAWVATLLRTDPREPATPWLSPPVLEAEGLLLRPFRDTDVARVQQACSDPVTQRWLGQLPAPYDEADAAAYVASRTDQLAEATGVTWAVVDPADDVVLASVGWFDHTPSVELEVGWWAHPDARGRGVVTRAARRVVEHAFTDLGVGRVKGLAASGNTASLRVLERLGMTRTGVERLGGQVRDAAGAVVQADLVLHDVLAAEWRVLAAGWR